MQMHFAVPLCEFNVTVEQQFTYCISITKRTVPWKISVFIFVKCKWNVWQQQIKNKVITIYENKHKDMKMNEWFLKLKKKVEIEWMLVGACGV